MQLIQLDIICSGSDVEEYLDQLNPPSASQSVHQSAWYRKHQLTNTLLRPEEPQKRRSVCSTPKLHLITKWVLKRFIWGVNQMIKSKSGGPKTLPNDRITSNLTHNQMMHKTRNLFSSSSSHGQKLNHESMNSGAPQEHRIIELNCTG